MYIEANQNHTFTTLIDNTFCSVELQGSYKSYILIDDISDHMPCLSILSDVFPTKMSAETITQHRLTEKAITEMKDHLESLDWNNLVSNDQNCEINYGTVHNILKETLDEYAPVRTVKLKRKKLSEPWLTKGLINCQCKQKLLYKRSIKLQDQDVTTNNVMSYKQYRSVLKKCKCSAKQQYYKDICTELKNNTKKLWQLINGIINKTSHKLHVIEKINKDGTSLTNTQEISNEFGRYFSSIG